MKNEDMVSKLIEKYGITGAVEFNNVIVPNMKNNNIDSLFNNQNFSDNAWDGLTDISAKLFRTLKLIEVLCDAYGFDCAKLSDSQMLKIKHEISNISALLNVINDYVFDSMKIADETLEGGFK